MTPSDTPIKAVVAVDFGTARSGYAIAFLRDRQVHYQEWWPGHLFPSVKTLTQLLYSPTGALHAWGYKVPREVARLGQEGANGGYHLLKHFKTQLHRGESGPHGPIVRSEFGRSFNVVDLIVAYLERLKEMALKHLRNSLAGELADDEVLWCLTVPAIWNPADRQWMRIAAVRAGMIRSDAADAGRLWLVLEPEAAALYCLHKDSASGVSMLRPGTRFMVVDAGGGTVDLTIHEVGPAGGLDEVVEADGDLFGSANIDQDFRRYLEERLTAAAVKDFHDLAPLAYLRMRIGWEAVKCSYHPEQGETVHVEFPRELADILHERHRRVLDQLRASQNNHVAYLQLSRRVMEELFRPTIEGVLGAVRRQFERLARRGLSCEYVFLVGGFAASPLLQQRVKEEFGPRVQKIVVPNNPGAAVVVGAVHYGLGPSLISSRRSRLTYGIRALAPFAPGVDPQARKVSKGDRGDWCERFCTFVVQGEAVGFNHKVKHVFAPLRPGQAQAMFGFFAVDGPAPTYFEPERMKRMGELTVHLPEQAGEQRIEVTMYFGRTEIAAEARDLHSGETRTVILVFRSDVIPELREG